MSRKRGGKQKCPVSSRNFHRASRVEKKQKKIKILRFSSDKSTRNRFARTKHKQKIARRRHIASTLPFPDIYIRFWLQFGRFASGKQATPSVKKELVPIIDSSPSLCTLPSMLYRWRETDFRNESKCSTVGNLPGVTRRA